MKPLPSRTGALLLASLAAACSGGESGGPRNLVLISIDTCRADHLGCYGFSKPTTPNLDALAASGALFEQASSTSPITLPSHSSLLTGTSPLRHRVLDNKYRLGEDSETLAEVLAARGYATAAFVSAFVLDARFGIGQGFAVYDDDLGASAAEGDVQEELINERRAGETNRAALSWLDANHRERFFLFLHYFDPHARYDPPAPFDARFEGDPYAGEIAYVDRCIGEVVARLEALGRMDDTLIVVTSDHGESLGEHGEPSHSYFVYQSTLHVPLIVRAPGALGGRRVREPVSLLDVAPTVLALLGEPPSPQHSGRNLGALLFDAQAQLADGEVYAESLYPTKYRAAALRALRLGRWKYIHSVDPELYDLEADPKESRNLAQGEAARAAVLEATLRGLLAESAGAGPGGGVLPLDAQADARIRALGYTDAGVREGFDIDPDAADAKERLALHNDLMRVHQASANGELEAASELAAELVSEHPWLLEAHALLGGLAARRGRSAEAVRHYEEYLQRAEAERALDPEGSGARLNPGVVAVLVALAEVQEQRKSFDRAAFCYQNALVLDPGHVDALLGYAVLLARDQRRFAQAAQLYELALGEGEDTQYVHANLGNCLYALGRLEQAAEHYERALELGPDAGVALSLGALLNELGRAREARELLTSLAAGGVSGPRVFAGLGSAQLALGETADAEQSFRRALALAPELAEAALGLSRCRLAAGDAAGARGQLSALLQGAPNAAGVLRSAVLQLAAHPDPDRRHPADALVFAEVLDQTFASSAPEALDALGVALAANGRFEEAAAAAERALAAPGELAVQVREAQRARLELYRAGRAFVLPTGP